VTPPDRTSVPGRPDLATLCGRHAKSWNAQPRDWPVPAMRACLRTHQDQVLRHVSCAFEAQRPPHRPANPRKQTSDPIPPAPERTENPDLDGPRPLPASSRRSRRRICERANHGADHKELAVLATGSMEVARSFTAHGICERALHCGSCRRGRVSQRRRRPAG